MMFKTNPHFNQYFGINQQQNNNQIPHQKKQGIIKHPNNSRNSSVYNKFQDPKEISHQDKNIYKKYLEPKHFHPDERSNLQCQSPESLKKINILDQFKLKKPYTTQFFNSKQSQFKTFQPDKKSKNDFYKQNPHLHALYSPKKAFTGDYFIDSLNFKDNHQQKNQNKNQSKDKSISSRNKKSPLRKIKRDQNHQMLYDPIQRVFKVVKQEQKARQQQKLNQKTLKHLHFIPTFSQLNDSFLNLPKNFKQIKSQKNFNQIKASQKNNRHDLALSRQYFDFKQIKDKKKQEVNKNRIKKTKSFEIIPNAVSQKNLKVKISSSKVKDYFSQKQEQQKYHGKIKVLLEGFDVRPFKQVKQGKFRPQIQFSQCSVSQPSKLSNSGEISNRNPVKSREQIEPYEYSQSGENSNYNSSRVNEQSEYASNMQKIASKKVGKQRMFNKSSQRVEEEIPLEMKNMKMYVVDAKERLKSPETQFYNLSQTINNYQNSSPSIQQHIPDRVQYLPKSSFISSKKSSHSENSNSQPSQSSQSDYQPIESVNTPAYRNGQQNQNLKNSVNNKLKNNNLTSNQQSLSVSSNMSENQLIQIDSKIHQKNFNLSKNKNHQSLQDKKIYLKSPKIESSSIINDLSNLIDDSQNNQFIKNRKLDNLLKQDQIQIQEVQKNVKMKTTPKLQTVKDHEFSEFQMIKQSQKELKKRANNQKQNDSALQMSLQSDLGLKSKKSIVYEQSEEQKSNEIPINSSVSQKKFMKNLSKQTIENKKDQNKKTIKFLKVNIKSNQIKESIRIQPTIKQQSYHEQSQQQSSLKTKQLFLNVKSEKSKDNQSIAKQKKSSMESNNMSVSKKSVENSSFSQSSQKSYVEESSHSKSKKKGQQNSRKNVQDSESSSSESSYSRTLTKSVTNNLSKASSPNNKSKSSLPNETFNLNLHSKESHSQSLVESSYNNRNNNSSQTSLSNSISQNILGNSTKKVENLSKKDSSLMFKKKINLAEYTLNDVARLIQEHEFRIQAFCLYVDNSKSIYEQDYELQKIQFSSFLMLKKSVYELNRAITALNGQGPNAFCLTEIEIADEIFEEFRQREEIRQQRDNMIKSKKQIFQELKETFLSLEKKYSGQKGFNLKLERDDFSTQIVKKLSQQLNLLYEKWQQNKSNDHQLPKITKKLEKRMMEIIELIFLTSELDGQKVKVCELFTDTESGMDFRSYYERWFQKIIETIEYFDARKSTNEDH